MKPMISISHETSDIEITDTELPTITDADLKWLEISRDELHRVFAEGQRLMAEREITEADRVRPVAVQTLDGEWFATLVQNSPLNDPLMTKTKKGVIN